MGSELDKSGPSSPLRALQEAVNKEGSDQTILPEDLKLEKGVCDAAARGSDMRWAVLVSCTQGVQRQVKCVIVVKKRRAVAIDRAIRRSCFRTCRLQDYCTLGSGVRVEKI